MMKIPFTFQQQLKAFGRDSFRNYFHCLKGGLGSFLCTFLPERQEKAQKIQSRPIRGYKGQQRPGKANEGQERPKQQKCVFSSIIYAIPAYKGKFLLRKLVFFKIDFHKLFVTIRTLVFFPQLKKYNHIFSSILNWPKVSNEISLSAIFRIPNRGVPSKNSTKNNLYKK